MDREKFKRVLVNTIKEHINFEGLLRDTLNRMLGKSVGEPKRIRWDDWARHYLISRTHSYMLKEMLSGEKRKKKPCKSNPCPEEKKLER